MNLLIVDDEPLIHVSIEYSLKEINADDVTIYHAYSGSEMLLQLDSVPMDIALVDIRMPGPDGLEAINQAKAMWPQTFYYIMSGYSEFEYAREAVRLNVVEYLLKPLEPETLQSVLAQVHDEKTQRSQLIRNQFRGWLEGTLHQHDVSSLFAKKHYAAIMLFTYDSDQRDQLFWVPDFTDTHHEYLLSLPCQEGILLMAYSPNVKVLYQLLQHIPKKELPSGITAFVSSVTNAPARLAEQMYQMLDFAPARVFYGIGCRYDASVLPKLNANELSLAKQWIQLRDHLFEGRYTCYCSLSSQLLSSLSESNLSSGSRVNLMSFINTITGHSHAANLPDMNLQRQLDRAGDMILQQYRRMDKIDSVLAYIEDHYCENLSISNLSSQFDLTPNYLSTLIKKRLGIKFTDHLTALRIAKAKELLLTTNHSVREITEQIGYYSQSHFTKLFIEKEGCTPTEFRNQEGALR